MGRPLTTPYSRLFLVEGGFRPDHKPAYQTCGRGGGLTQPMGDKETIECPSPDEYGQHDKIGESLGAEGLVTTTFTARFMAAELSEFRRLARRRCRVDAVVNIGACTNPSDYNAFTKKVVLLNAHFTDYGTDDLGALEGGEASKVNETVDVSADDSYEIVRLAFAERAGNLITNEQVDVVICSLPSCGDCDDEDDGCEKIYSVSLGEGGSLLTPADVTYSLDKGATWDTSSVDSLGQNEDPTAIFCVSNYVVVVSADSCSLHYVLQSELDALGGETWLEVGGGFEALHCPLDGWSVGTYAFIAGQAGYVYGTSDPTGGVAVLENGALTHHDLNAIHALNDRFAVAVGDAGDIIMTRNRTIWTEVNGPTAANLSTVWVVSEKVWWIGTETGFLFFTLDAGATWYDSTFDGSGVGAIHDIAFVDEAVGYVSHASTTPRGRLFRTYDGGQSWVVLPEGTGVLPLNDRFTAIAACKHDANFAVAVGLADNAADGIIVIGSAYEA